MYNLSNKLQGEPGNPGNKGEPGLPGTITYIPAQQETHYIRPVSIYLLMDDRLIKNKLGQGKKISFLRMQLKILGDSLKKLFYFVQKLFCIPRSKL